MGTAVRNVRLYPPGVKTDGSQIFHPEFLPWCGGRVCIRFMQELDCTGTSLTTFEELRQEGQEIQLGGKVISAQIVKVEPYDNEAQKRSYMIGDRITRNPSPPGRIISRRGSRSRSSARPNFPPQRARR